MPCAFSLKQNNRKKAVKNNKKKKKKRICKGNWCNTMRYGDLYPVNSNSNEKHWLICWNNEHSKNIDLATYATNERIRRYQSWPHNVKKEKWKQYHWTNSMWKDADVVMMVDRDSQQYCRLSMQKWIKMHCTAPHCTVQRKRKQLNGSCRAKKRMLQWEWWERT